MHDIQKKLKKEKEDNKYQHIIQLKVDLNRSRYPTSLDAAILLYIYI